MQVETFECQETAYEPLEASEEALAIAEQLGLEGQKSLFTRREDCQQPSRCPYPEATLEQLQVFQLLCPERTELSRYARTPIPLRVLQVAAHAASIGFFQRLEVWDRVSQEVSDPVLIGRTSRYEWDGKVHLLARWGETLDAWPLMVKAARCILHTKSLEVAREKMRKLSATLASLQDMPADSIPLDFTVEV